MISDYLVIVDECAPFSAIDWEKLRRSRYLRELRGDWLEVETPDYDPQGDAMPPYGCDNPGCPQCHPQTASETVKNRAGSLPSWNTEVRIDWAVDLANKELRDAVADAFKISVQDLGLSKQNKEQSMSITAQRVIADLQSLEDKDFPAISKEIDNIKARRKDSLEENLDGVARMACMDKSTPELRPFVLSYFKDGRVNTVQGVEVGNSSLVKEGEEHKETRVYVFGRDYPVTGTHYTMKIFEKALEENNIPYAFVYRSK